MFIFYLFIILSPGSFLLGGLVLALAWALRKMTKLSLAASLVTVVVIMVGGISLLVVRNYSEFEPLINLVCPPDDLYVPLASVPLSATTTNYSLEVQHKYSGNHSVVIQTPSGYKHPVDKEGKAMLRMHYKVFEGSKLIREEICKDGYPFWGRDKIYCFSYWDYKVPKDLPRSIPLRFEISLLGDVASFLAENEKTKLVIGKVSDE